MAKRRGVRTDLEKACSNDRLGLEERWRQHLQRGLVTGEGLTQRMSSPDNYRGPRRISERGRSDVLSITVQEGAVLD